MVGFATWLVAVILARVQFDRRTSPSRVVCWPTVRPSASMGARRSISLDIYRLYICRFNRAVVYDPLINSGGSEATYKRLGDIACERSSILEI